MKLNENLFEEYNEYDDIDPECIRDGMVAVMCDCGYEDIIPLSYYDGCCPRCHGHTGEYGPVPFDEFDESLKEDYYSKGDKAWEVVEKIKSRIDDGSIDKDEFIDKMLQWFYLEPVFLSFVASNKFLSKRELDSLSLIPESLKEDLDDVVEIEVPDVVTDVTQDEITPQGPSVGVDTGVANAILDLINSENNTISDYNGFISTVAESHPEFISVIQDISNEENNHVGMLTQLLKQVSPNAETIKQGESEAEKDLLGDRPSLEDTVDFEVDDIFDDAFGGLLL